MDTNRRRRLLHQVLFLVVTSLVIAIGIVWATQDSGATAPPRSDRAQVAGRDAAAARCVSDPALPCDALARKKARQFRHGRLGTSKSYRLPRKVRRMLDRATGRAAGHGAASRDGGAWWRAPLSNAACIPLPMMRRCGSGSVPAEDMAALHDRLTRTTKVALACGGSAAIGFVQGGGPWGAGRGGAVCLWMVLMRHLGWV